MVVILEVAIFSVQWRLEHNSERIDVLTVKVAQLQQQNALIARGLQRGGGSRRGHPRTSVAHYRNLKEEKMRTLDELVALADAGDLDKKVIDVYRPLSKPPFDRIGRVDITRADHQKTARKRSPSLKSTA